MTLEDHVEALRAKGYTIVEGMLAPAEVEEARFALAEVFQHEERIGPRRGWHNDAYSVTYLLPQKHPLFRSFCQREKLLSLMRAVLGPRCIVSALNGFTTTPGGRDQRLHIDQEETVPGAILSINAVHALDEFSRANGCTRLVSASQNRMWTGDAADIEAAEAEAIYVEAPAGSVIAYDGGLWHASSRNQTGEDRFAVHAFFSREWIRPHWDFPLSLSPDVQAALTPEQRQLFGFSALPRRYDACSHRIVRGEASWRDRIAGWLSALGRLAGR